MSPFQLDEQVDAYEAALVAGETGLDDIDRFLPQSDDENNSELLVELLRITVEHTWQPGQVDALSPLLLRFPQLKADRILLAPLAYEEYRLRVGDGQNVSRQEYADRFGIDVSQWQEIAPEPTEEQTPLPNVSRSSWEEFSMSAPGDAAKIAVARRRLPAVGERFGPFQLVALLGKGAFGSVFLARQNTLADRYVALKITAGPAIEADRLARMQHGNIVPVYSVHRRGRLSAVCMPYLGGVTLADFVARLKADEHLPTSGQRLIDTVLARQAELSTVLEANEPGELQSGEPREAPAVEQALARLAARPLEEAIVWLMSRVAAGLAHAHRRGIVHRDLKPANILISDDGEPLVLDFNLASDQSPAAGHLARLGGTLPYMAPEQLASFRSSSDGASPASDVYSLGVVLYECLTRQHPFPIRLGTLDAVVETMLDDRRTAPLAASKRNPSVSPALESIVAKCLEPNPRRRYQDAAELHDDLQRQLDNRPLKYAPDRSPAERMRKWTRRHPRLSSATSIALAAALLASVAGGLWMARENRFAQQAAEETFRDFHAAIPQARTLLIISQQKTSEEQQGLEEARQLLRTYSVEDKAKWQAQPAVSRLTSQSREQLLADVADLRFLVDRRMTGTGTSPISTTTAALKAAGGNEEPTAKLVAAMEAGMRGRAEAVKQMQALVSSRIDDAASWLVLAECQWRAGDLAGADASCTAAIALRSDLYLPWYNRGRIRVDQKRSQDAEADFDEALRRRPHFPSGWANRGLTRHDQRKFTEAIDDFTRAIDNGATEPIVYFARARCYEATGKKDAAVRDFEEGLAQPPRTAQGWFERGMVNLRRGKFEAAESDFHEAAELAPEYIDALRDLAHVQSERLNKQREGIETQARILALKPDDIEARAARGVLHARLGNDAEALADAAAVLTLNPPPLAVYQVACIYALLGEKDADKRNLALAHMQRAFLLQPSIMKIARDDPDLKNLHQEERFRRGMAALEGKKTN